MTGMTEARVAVASDFMDGFSCKRSHYGRRNLACAMGYYPTGNFWKPASNPASSLLKHRTPDYFPMRPFEVAAPETHGLGSRAPPKRRGIAAIHREPEHTPGGLDVVAEKIGRVGLVGTGFKDDVHIFSPGLSLPGS